MATCDGSCIRHRIGIAELRPGPAVRSSPLNPAHVAGIAAHLDQAPPVLVACPSRRLLDGHHRVAAARRRGQDDIEVVWWHGEPAEMFTIAVQRNAGHGRALTGRERRMAAVVLVRTHADMSDRRIARTCGLSPSTVGTIRRESTVHDAGAASRAAPQRQVIGADGKRYPVLNRRVDGGPVGSGKPKRCPRALLVALWRVLKALAGRIRRNRARPLDGAVSPETQVSRLDT